MEVAHLARIELIRVGDHHHHITEFIPAGFITKPESRGASEEGAAQGLLSAEVESVSQTSTW